MDRFMSSRSLKIAAFVSVFFVGLRFIGFVDWPWLWVLSPLWITASVGAGIMAAIIWFDLDA